MDSHADIWVRSGRNPRLLHEGSTENIVAELKAWVERRRAHNDTDMAAHWNMFQFLDSLQQIGDPSSKVQQGQAAKMMDRIATITATQLEHLDYTRVRYLLIVKRVSHYLNHILEPQQRKG